jgi:hypothetical protein
MQSASPPKESPLTSEEGVETDGAALASKAEQRLRLLFGALIKLEAHRIDVDEALEAYGIDSILVTQFNLTLQETFPGLPKTLLYEHQTLRALAHHLAHEHRQACARWIGVAADKRGLAASTPKPAAPRASTARRKLGAAAKGTRQHLVAGAVPAYEPIAIVGLSGRYAKSPDLATFWENLKNERDCIEEIPADRWSLANFYSPARDAAEQGRSNSRWGGFIEGFSEFDAMFFSIAPRDAQNMDPQERLFLQTSWEVIEDAGYSRESLREKHQGRVGVFAGVTTTGFEHHAGQIERSFHPRTSFSSVANRVSYFFDFHGPSLPIDTMCSSSLTAIHEACIHLQRRDCELAIAGGVNLYVHPASYVMRSGMHMLSSEGLCRSFGEGGDGYVRRCGCGALEAAAQGHRRRRPHPRRDQGQRHQPRRQDQRLLRAQPERPG